MKLLTESNSKILKGKARGFSTFGMHLAPFTLSGYNTCAHASKGCAESCLNTAGHGAFQTVQDARIRKTKWFFSDRNEFLSVFAADVATAHRRAERRGHALAIRPNLTSDVSWESIKFPFVEVSIMDLFPTITWYDYTKNFRRMERYLAGEFPPNYSLTFSRSEENDHLCRKVLDAGGNVAMVFSSTLPKTWLGHRVIDGDADDLRFLDPANCIVGLVAKGKAKKDTSGFVIEH